MLETSKSTTFKSKRYCSSKSEKTNKLPINNNKEKLSLLSNLLLNQGILCRTQTVLNTQQHYFIQNEQCMKAGI